MHDRQRLKHLIGDDYLAIHCEGMLPYFDGVSYGTEALFDVHELFEEVDVQHVSLPSFKGLRSGGWYRVHRDLVLNASKIGPGISWIENKLGVEKIPNTWGDLVFYHHYPEAKGGVVLNDGIFDTVRIFDVSHGNTIKVWCKEREGSGAVWFDYGCEFRLSAEQIAAKALYLESFRSPKDIAIISHWDLDHSILLGEMKTTLQGLYACEPMPRTKRRAKIRRNLEILGVEVHVFKFAPNRGDLIESDVCIGGVKVWVPAAHNNPNRRSLVVTSTNNDSVLLCGDQHYGQICSKITGLASKVNIVVSHHGGFAGAKPENLNNFTSGAVVVSGAPSVFNYANRSIDWDEFSGAQTTWGRAAGQYIDVDY